MNYWSWSQLQTFLTCERKWELQYREKLATETSDEMALGGAFHAGIAAHLMGADPYLAATHKLNESQVNDDDYLTVKELLSYHLPKISGRYEVVEKDGKPLVEHYVEYKLDNDNILVGYIDAVLYDVVQKETVIVDWKLRTRFSPEVYSALDGQLHLYAAMLDMPVQEVVMWEFRNKVPQPASISVRTGLPNTGAESYDTTWEYWCKTVPAYIKPADWEGLIRPKLKDESEFVRPVRSVVTEYSKQAALDNVRKIISRINTACIDDTFSAVYNSYVCRFCPYWRLCSTTLRYGGNSDNILLDYYKDKI